MSKKKLRKVTPKLSVKSKDKYSSTSKKGAGLTQKGRDKYNRATGGNLKAPSKKVGNARRKSFCERMGGMKLKLTSAKTANDPNSRINQALKNWNCKKDMYA